MRPGSSGLLHHLSTNLRLGRGGTLSNNPAVLWGLSLGAPAATRSGVSTQVPILGACMNETVREILGFLENGKPELQVAAAQILGELKPRESAVGKALEAVFERTSDRRLVRYVLDALAKIGGADAVRTLARSLQAADAVGDQAAHLLAEIGRSAHPILAEQFDSAAVEARAR